MPVAPVAQTAAACVQKQGRNPGKGLKPAASAREAAVSRSIRQIDYSRFRSRRNTLGDAPAAQGPSLCALHIVRSAPNSSESSLRRVP